MYVVNDDGMLMAVSPVPSVMMFFVLRGLPHITHFLHQQDATVSHASVAFNRSCCTHSSAFLRRCKLAVTVRRFTKSIGVELGPFSVMSSVATPSSSLPSQ